MNLSSSGQLDIILTSERSSLLYKHQWNIKSACFQRPDLLCNHNDSDLFMCEDNMTVIFACQDKKFSWESSLGISLVFV